MRRVGLAGAWVSLLRHRLEIEEARVKWGTRARVRMEKGAPIGGRRQWHWDAVNGTGNVAKMNISMPIRHSVFITRFGALADEHADPGTRVGLDQLRTTRGLARSSRKNVRA